MTGINHSIFRVRDFFVTISNELARPLEDVEPFITELEKRWYMTVAQLRDVPESVWKEINVPPGLLQLIMKKVISLTSNNGVSSSVKSKFRCYKSLITDI